MMDLVTTTVSGAAFGAALTASGVWNPATIIEQMRFNDFHMVKVFMMANSASALFIHLLSRSGYVAKKPRPPSLFGIGIPYEGNIIGGVVVGIGMTLTGACPGTVLVQVATKTYPGIYTLSGGISGGILYVSLQRFLRRSEGCAKPQQQSHWLDQKLRVDPDVAVLVFEAICVAVVGAAMILAPSAAPSGSFLHPVIGGLLIGVAQLASLVLRGAPVGISTAYEDIGAKVCKTIQACDKSEERKSVLMPTSAMVFAAGVMLGAVALVHLEPKFAVTATKIGLGISPARAVAGGAAMVFGARLAGGCTSGHGISGMSMLATSSVVTVVSMFLGGMSLASILS